MAAGLAVITGAATGVGYFLARLAAETGYDLVISDEDTLIYGTVSDCLHYGADVLPVQACLSTARGIDDLLEAVGDRPVDIICAAPHLDDIGAIEGEPHGIAPSAVGCSHLIRNMIELMIVGGRGRILLASPRSAAAPATADSALFLNRFADSLRERLAGGGDSVTLTTLLLDPPVQPRGAEMGGSTATPDPAEAARLGWKALAAGNPSIIVRATHH